MEITNFVSFSVTIQFLNSINYNNNFQPSFLLDTLAWFTYIWSMFKLLKLKISVTILKLTKVCDFKKFTCIFYLVLFSPYVLHYIAINLLFNCVCVDKVLLVGIYHNR